MNMKKYHQNRESRRAFLGDVGRGMVAASVGATVANDLGFSTAFAETSDHGSELKFGKLEPLVSTMRDTPPDKLQQLLVAKLRNGEATLKDLTAAGALANARTFRRRGLRRLSLHVRVGSGARNVGRTAGESAATPSAQGAL